MKIGNREVIQGNDILVSVNTPYGDLNVLFMIIDIVSESDNTCLAYAQKRVAVIQYKADKNWHVIRDMDLVYFIEGGEYIKQPSIED